jgi:ankyrin repeat protein
MDIFNIQNKLANFMFLSKALKEIKENKSLRNNNHELDSSNNSLLHISAASGDAKSCIKLINAGLNVNAQNNSLWTPLHFACFIDNIEVVKLLIENKSNINSIADSSQKNFIYDDGFQQELIENTPLDIAYQALPYSISQYTSPVIKLLISHGALTAQSINSEGK